MDAFFASVEVRDRPELANKPVIIGNDGGRGVVASATYQARALGVHSAMPISQALRLAPHAVVVPPDMRKYSEVSHRVMDIFNQFTPMVQQLSIDEAFIDVSGAIKLIGSPTEIARMIRQSVWEQERITCSVGIAPTMFIAKLATNHAKPDGIFVVPSDGVLTFLHPLPITAMWGVGEKTASELSRLGLTTIGDIASVSTSTLSRVIGEAHAQQLSELAWGRDPRTVTTEHVEHTIGNERTFDHDVDDIDELTNQLMYLCDMVARRLRQAKVATRTIAIKVRFADFKTITRHKTVPNATDTAQEIFQIACQLFNDVYAQHTRIRLLGVRAEQLVSQDDVQPQLNFSNREQGWREAEQVLDQVAEKFGKKLLRQARLVRRDSDESQPASKTTPRGNLADNDD
mgnify:CR=1 FL=1